MQARKALSAAMKRLRAESKLSQSELAELASLSSQHIAALEQGRKEPSLTTLDMLAKAFGVPLPELFVPDERAPRRGVGAEIADLVNGLTPAQRERVLVIVREACALAPTARRGR